MFDNELRKLIVQIEQHRIGPDEQQEMATCLYMEILAIRKEDLEIVRNKPVLDNMMETPVSGGHVDRFFQY